MVRVDIKALGMGGRALVTQGCGSPLPYRGITSLSWSLWALEADPGWTGSGSSGLTRSMRGLGAGEGEGRGIGCVYGETYFGLDVHPMIMPQSGEVRHRKPSRTWRPPQAGIVRPKALLALGLMPSGVPSGSRRA